MTTLQATASPIDLVNYGAIGLGFLFLYLAYKFFTEEQKIEGGPRKQLLIVGVVFMVVGTALTAFFGYLEFQPKSREMNEMLHIETEIRNLKQELDSVRKQGVQVVILKETQPNGTDAGTLQGDNWKVRKLNVIESSGASSFVDFDPADHTFSLSKGKYWVRAVADIYHNNAHRIRIFNMTENQPEIHGLNAYSADRKSDQRSTGKGPLTGLIIVDSESKFRLEHRTQLRQYNGSFTGIASALANEEIYAQVEVIKLE